MFVSNHFLIISPNKIFDINSAQSASQHQFEGLTKVITDLHVKPNSRHKQFSTQLSLDLQQIIRGTTFSTPQCTIDGCFGQTVVLHQVFD